MFECTICGLLSLGGSACPACGSQIRVDLAEQDEGGAPLPSEVPGLDEAVASWNELEGIEPANDAEEQGEEEVQTPKGNLPFGFSGASNTNVSRLPFGIGSYAAGMPFDGDADGEERLPLVSAEQSASTTETVGSSQLEDPSSGPEEIIASLPEPVPPPAPVAPPQPPTEAPPNAPAPVAPQAAVPLPTPPGPGPAEALPRLEAQAAQEAPIPRLQAVASPSPAPAVQSLAITPAPSVIEAAPEVNHDVDVPDLWRIDAAAPDMDEIYAQADQVVEVVHTMEAEPTVFAHEPDEPTAALMSGVISLDLHPAQALEVSLAGMPEYEDTLRQGYQAMGAGEWAQAAIAFQKLAAKMPGDSAVFNNYGLSLLQRALTMAKSTDLDIQNLATTQFESSILALREAAKSAPTEATILLNLGHALLVSGRAEKAIGLVQMHDQLQPQSTVSGNLHAAALVSMGESSAAKALLQRLVQDDVVQSNLARLSY